MRKKDDHRFNQSDPAFPARLVYGVYVLSSACRAFLATVACPAKDLASLIPASGDRDHTILPSASTVLVSHSLSVHRLPPQRP